MCCRLVAVNREDDFLDQRAQQLLSIPRRRRRRIPDDGQVSPEGEQAFTFLSAEDAGALLLAAGELSLCGLKVGQALLPLALQPARDEPVIGVDRPIAALRAARLVS